MIGTFRQYQSGKQDVSVLNEIKKFLQEYGEYGLETINLESGLAVSKLTDESRNMLNSLKSDGASVSEVIDSIESRVVGLNKSASQSTKLFTNLGNTILNGFASLGISTAISLLISLVSDLADELIITSKEAEVLSNQFSDAYNSLASSQAKTAKEIADIEKEYEELSQGVNQLGENMSLTDEEFERYHEITRIIAENMPELVQGYDDQGEAIIRLKDNVESLNTAYMRNQELAAMDLYKKTDDNGNVIKGVYEKARQDTADIILGERTPTGGYNNEDAFDIQEQLASRKKMAEATLDELKDLYLNGTKYEKMTLGSLGFTSRTDQEQFREINATLRKNASDLEATLEDDAHRVAQAGLTYAQAYQGFYTELSSEQQKYVSGIMNSLDFNFIQSHGLFDQNAMEKYVQDVMDLIKGLTPDQMKSLEFGINLTTQWNNDELTYDEYIQKIQALDTLLATLFPGNEEIQKTFKILFDIPDEDELANKQDIFVNRIAEKRGLSPGTGHGLTPQEMTPELQKNYEQQLATVADTWYDTLTQSEREFVDNLSDEDLAKAVKFESTEQFDTWLEKLKGDADEKLELKVSASEAIDSIAEAKSAITSLDDLWEQTVQNNIALGKDKKYLGEDGSVIKQQDTKGQAVGYADPETLISVRSAFDKFSKDLESKGDKQGAETINHALQAFEKTLVEFPGDAEKAQAAIDHLVTAYIDQTDIIKNLTEENAEWSEAQLKAMGVTNAHEVVQSRLSKSVKKTQEALTLLAKKIKAYNDAIANGETGTEQFEDMVEGVQNALKMYDENGQEINIGVDVDDSFVQQHLEDIQAMAAGDVEALDRVRLAAAKKAAMEVSIHVPSDVAEAQVNGLMDLVAQADAMDIDVGASIDDSAFIATLNAMIKSATVSADAVSAAFESMGYTVQFKQKTAKVKIVDPGAAGAQGTWVRDGSDAGGHMVYHTVTRDDTISIPEVEIIRRKGGKASGAGVSYGGGGTGTGSGGGGGGGGGGGSDAQNDSEQSYDWVETAIQRIEREISNLDKVVNSTYENWSKRNNTLANEIKKVTDEIKAQQDAVSVYKQKTNAIVTEYTTGEGALSADVVNKYVKKVQNGEINTGNINESLETIKGNEKLVDFISKYTEFYEKYLAAVDKQYDLEQQRYSLIEQGFNLVKTEFEKAIEVITDGYSFVDKRINRIQEHGYFVNDSYYNQQIGYKKSEKTQMEKELDALRAYMKKEGASLNPKSEAYQDLMKQIRDLELSIEDAATDLVVLQKTIREAAWERFDWLQGRISNIVDESNFMVEIIGEDRLYDRDTGLFNEKAWATAGLYMTNYDIYAKQVGEYEKEYKRVQKELAKDPNNKEIREHLEEINSQWQEAINNVQEQKQNIKNLVEEGINEYLSKLQEAIDDYKKLLQNAKSLYEWQNTIDEKAENIARLRKQLSVYGGDDSEENRANLQRLNQQLSDAEKDLKETEWDHYIQETESFLDEMYSDMEEFLNKYLEDIDLVVKDIATGVNERGKEISETVKSEAKAVGYNLSDTMNSIFAADGIVVSTINKNGDLINKISGQVTTVVSAINQLEDTIKKIMVNDETGKKVEDESPKTKDEGQDYKKDSDDKKSTDDKKKKSDKSNLIPIDKGAVRRLYNKNTGEHFYTTNDTEASTLVKAGWKDEGAAWLNETGKNKVPVYRVYNPNSGLHLFTANLKEKDNLTGLGWKDEGIAFYGYNGKDGLPVYRLYNGKNHFYTLSAEERDKLKNAGWKYNGVAWYANPYADNDGVIEEIENLDKDKIKTIGGFDRAKGYATGSEHIDKDQLAWTQENGGEIIYRKKDGAVLTPLNTGDKVFTNEMSQRLWELASNNNLNLINSNGTVPNVSNVTTTVNQNNTINITLPNVTNYEQFKTALQNDSKFEGFIKEITFGQALGYNSLKKYSY